ncbi:unnamed protein product [Acanthoscelides obtectus]|nr:unnamed protein product [Acanthoscelides obtectus]CAK1667445.1 28S ribosomal protein S31, mitochondrial [Acanthoscelides obtectus]
MVKAVKDVATDLGGDTKQTESELLMKLLNPETSPTSATNLMDIMKGMRIDRETKTAEKSRAEQVRSILQTAKSRISKEGPQPERRMKRLPQHIQQKKEIVVQKIDLFGGEALNIFTNKSELTEVTQTKTWQRLYERDLKLAVTHPPSNYFQQLMLWTEQEKLWKFPIDNEQGLDEEKKVDFSKHVFLEEHLEPWCPAKGPLRHFMELVCVGLSKNAYLTVDAKIEHILWYKDYFESKKKLLKDTGAILAEREAPKAVQ